jgi:hypothetical protein
MSIIISNINIPPGCQKCKFFKKHLFGNGLDYSYSCILGSKDFPMPWIRQMEERASDCPIEPLEQEPIDKSAMMYEIYMEGVNMTGEYQGCWVRFRDIEKIVNKYMTESEVIRVG